MLYALAVDFVEADVREERYCPTKLCYSPVYRRWNDDQTMPF